MRRSERLHRYTSLRIGGPADYFAEPASVEALQAVVRWAGATELPITVLGGGTNLLVADGGLRGCVIRLTGTAFATLQLLTRPDTTPDEVWISAGAAVPTSQLVAHAIRWNGGGLTPLVGLPGSVGGAIAVNAQDICKSLVEVTTLTSEGIVERLPQRALAYRYRYTDLRNRLVLQAVLRFPRDRAGTMAQEARATLTHRLQTQEYTRPSAGCVFKNPEGGSAAGWLIDQAGCKGWRRGNAMVSERHANFIVNCGSATAKDVLTLMEDIQHQVQASFGTLLEPEVRILGEDWAGHPSESAGCPVSSGQ